MPLAAFPKCFLDELCVHRTMTVYQWIDLASTLPGVTGVEFYSAFLPDDEDEMEKIRVALNAKKLALPMLCCSPDFTSPDASERKKWIEQEKRWIEQVAFFGGKTCRILSGQRRPDLPRKEGVRRVVDGIKACLDHAEKYRVILAMENHYKDNYWQFPEFAQKMEVFVEIVSQIDSPWFGVNYDPSNTIIAGEDPIALLEAVAPRVVSMHASDRYLEGGTLEDLRRMEADPHAGYAKILKHGVIGRGMNDYDKIFSILARHNFRGWISIEDGPDPAVGMRDLQESAEFLLKKMKQHGLE